MYSFSLFDLLTLQRYLSCTLFNGLDKNIKRKLSHYTSRRRMGERWCNSYSFSTSALYGGELSASLPGLAYFLEGGVGQTQSWMPAFMLAYYVFPRWYEFGERRWNDIDGENRKTRRKTCPSATLSTTNPTWIDPGANPGLRGERPATNDLSHGTAIRPRFSPGERTPGTHCTGGWVGPRAGLDTETIGNILSPLLGIEPWSPGRPALSQTLYRLSYPAHR
jgi:hypothetical protein